MSKKSKPMAVKFMGHSGSGTAERIAVRIGLAERGLGEMVDTFVNAQLEVEMSVSASSVPDAPEGQGKLIDGMDDEFSGVAECRSLTINAKTYGLSFAFVASEIDVAALAKMSGRDGTLTVKRTGDAKESEE